MEAPKTPSEILETCKKFIHHRDFLRLENVALSAQPMDLILRLLCVRRRRYAFGEIIKHPFFTRNKMKIVDVEVGSGETAVISDVGDCYVLCYVGAWKRELK